MICRLWIQGRSRTLVANLNSSDSDADLANPYGRYSLFGKYVKSARKTDPRTKDDARNRAEKRYSARDTSPDDAAFKTERSRPRARQPQTSAVLSLPDSDSDGEVTPTIKPRAPPRPLELSDSGDDADGYYETKFSKMLRECRPAVRPALQTRAISSDEEDEDIKRLTASITKHLSRPKGSLSSSQPEGRSDGYSQSDGHSQSNGHRAIDVDSDEFTPRRPAARGAGSNGNPLSELGSLEVRAPRKRVPALTDSDDETAHADLEKYRPAAPRALAARSSLRDDDMGEGGSVVSSATSYHQGRGKGCSSYGLVRLGDGSGRLSWVSSEDSPLDSAVSSTRPRANLAAPLRPGGLRLGGPCPALDALSTTDRPTRSARPKYTAEDTVSSQRSEYSHEYLPRDRSRPETSERAAASDASQDGPKYTYRTRRVPRDTSPEHVITRRARASPESSRSRLNRSALYADKRGSFSDRAVPDVVPNAGRFKLHTPDVEVPVALPLALVV